MEIFWLVTFFLSAIASFYIHQKSNRPDYMLYGLPVAALVMYFMRRTVRKRTEKHE
jgi:multisubunit Na+/H+ antiporter MnhE subunit